MKRKRSLSIGFPVKAPRYITRKRKMQSLPQTMCEQAQFEDNALNLVCTQTARKSLTIAMKSNTGISNETEKNNSVASKYLRNSTENKILSSTPFNTKTRSMKALAKQDTIFDSFKKLENDYSSAKKLKLTKNSRDQIKNIKSIEYKFCDSAKRNFPKVVDERKCKERNASGTRNRKKRELLQESISDAKSAEQRTLNLRNTEARRIAGRDIQFVEQAEINSMQDIEGMFLVQTEGNKTPQSKVKKSSQSKLSSNKKSFKDSNQGILPEENSLCGAKSCQCDRYYDVDETVDTVVDFMTFHLFDFFGLK